MKRSKLEELLRLKFRLKITRRSRGQFEVLIPGNLTTDRRPAVKLCATKREALNFLFVQLRCLDEIVIEVRKAEVPW